MEEKIKQFILSKLENFTDLILNFNDFYEDLLKQKSSFYEQDNNPNAKDLINLIVLENLINAISLIDKIKLIQEEFVVLESGRAAGKQPSIDILAYDEIKHTLAIIELKVDYNAERQIITELSAYSQGLQNKFRGLSYFDFIWIPISNYWRVMPKSAVEFQMVWNKVLCLPLKLDYTLTGQDIETVSLNCFNPTLENDFENYVSLFTYGSFDTLDFYTSEPISNPDALNQFISSLCSKYNISGFSLYHKPNKQMFQYGLTMCIFNPYKAYLISRFLKKIKESDGEDKMFESIKDINSNTNLGDIDFKTDEFKEWIFTKDQMEGTSLKCDAYWQKDFLSVGDFADNPENNKLNLLVKELKSHLQLISGNKFAFGYPDFKIFFKENTKENPVLKVIYFGFFQEIINQMLRFDFEKLNKTSINKKLEEISINDPLIAISDFKYLQKFMEIMNYENI